MKAINFQSEYDKQANDFLKKTGATIKVKFFKYAKHFQNDKQERDIYKVTISKGGETFTFDFGQSLDSSWPNERKQPSDYDVLTCLQKYDVGSFEDFCDEFGYDADSRNAEKIYKAVCNEYENLCRIWNDSEIKELQEIQ